MFEQKIHRYRAFLTREPTDRPLIGSWLAGFYINQLYPHVAEALSPGFIEPNDLPIDLYLKDVDNLYKSYQGLNDDYPFSMGPLYGIPWMDAIMGCPISYDGTTMQAQPCIHDWETYEWRRPTLENPWARKLLQFLKALIDHSDGRFPCSASPMHGITDLCANMLGTDRLIQDLHDTPENVKRLAETCADVWIDIGRAQLNLIPESSTGYLVSCGSLRCWMPEKGIWLQDDGAMRLSQEIYQVIFLPQLQSIARAFNKTAFHMHSTGLWLADVILKMGEITVLEVNYDVGSVELDEIIPLWKKIQTMKPCIIFTTTGMEEINRIVEELSPNGLSIQSLSSGIEEGIAKRNLVYSRADSR